MVTPRFLTVPTDTVPRPYQHAVDEARWRTREKGVQDDRPEIIEHWRTARTWLRSPILVAGEVTGTSLGNECLVGFTRLGNLVGLLDRQDIPEYATHRVWHGTAAMDLTRFGGQFVVSLSDSLPSSNV